MKKKIRISEKAISVYRFTPSYLGEEWLTNIKDYTNTKIICVVCNRKSPYITYPLIERLHKESLSTEYDVGLHFLGKDHYIAVCRSCEELFLLMPLLYEYEDN